MPDQFVVPQFIDAEDKIMGPISVRQFLILLGVMLTDAILYKLLPFTTFLLVAIPLFIIGVVFAFVKINGQPFHYFLLNIVQTFRKPQLRIWGKIIDDSILRSQLKIEEKEPPPVIPKKPPITSSHLQDLSMIVNTGGVYQPEE